MTTNEWTRATHHEFAHNTSVRVSRGGASLQACVLVLLFAAAVMAERNDCAAYALDSGRVAAGMSWDGDADLAAKALYKLGHELDEDQHANWRTPA